MDAPTPAATIILLREAEQSGPPEMLMVQRDRSMAFAAGAWVWPGGRVDPEDHDAASGNEFEAAKIAAIREAREEVGMPPLDPAALVPFARWLPKFVVERRFDTWFFLARAPEDWPLALQDREIIAAKWTSAAAMLELVEKGEAGAIFPTKRNLERLARFATIDEAFADAAAHRLDPITPWVEEDEDGNRHVCIPDDLGYPVTSEPLTSAVRA